MKAILRSTVLVFISILTLVTGCTERSVQQLTTSDLFDAAIDAPDLPQDLWTLDEQFAEINRLNPNFAGLYLDDAGILNIKLVNADKSSNTDDLLSSAEEDISAVMGSALLNSSSRTVSVPAKYSFNQLAFWKNQMISQVNFSEVVWTDIDDVQNTVTYGVLNSGVEAKMRSIAKTLGIPDDVFRFMIAEPVVVKPAVPDEFELFATANTNVRLANNPRIGGVEIGPPNGGTCTLGINASLMINFNEAPRLGFITNSHCTASKSALDPATASPFKQPYGGVAIGKEARDKSPFSCNYGRCRYSDSAFIAYNSNINSIRSLAVTRTRTNSGVSSFAIEHVYGVRNSQYGKNQTIVIGQQLFKTGRTTGTSVGNVTRQCVDYGQLGTDVQFLCQYTADYHAEPGDSGSPVFQGGKLYGMHWGVFTGTAIFSPMTGIKRDLGEINTINPNP